MNILVLCATDETVKNQQWINFLPKRYLSLKDKVYYTGLDITEDVSNNIHKKSIAEFNKYIKQQFDFIINEFCMDSLNIDIYNLINKKLKTNGYYIDVAMITDEIEIYDKNTRELKNIFFENGVTSVTSVTQSVTQNSKYTNGYRVLVTLLHLLHHFLKNKKQNKKL